MNKILVLSIVTWPHLSWLFSSSEMITEHRFIDTIHTLFINTHFFYLFFLSICFLEICCDALSYSFSLFISDHRWSKQSLSFPITVVAVFIDEMIGDDDQLTTSMNHQELVSSTTTIFDWKRDQFASHRSVLN